MLAWASTCGENIHWIDGPLFKKGTFLFPRDPPLRPQTDFDMVPGAFALKSMKTSCRAMWTETNLVVEYFTRGHESKSRDGRNEHAKFPTRSDISSHLHADHSYWTAARLCDVIQLADALPVWELNDAEQWSRSSQCPPSMKVPGLIPAWAFLYAVFIFSWSLFNSQVWNSHIG